MDRNYDSLGHLVEEYLTPPKGESFLYHTFFYSDGALTEMKSFDYKGNWIYSYLYEFDKSTNVKTVYLYNTVKKLREEFFYDDQKRLIKEKFYGGIIPIYLDHSTKTFSYSATGLIETEEYQDPRGGKYYYRHFYQSEFRRCDPVFVRVERLPSLKISANAFEDSLVARLKSRDFPMESGEITYKFIITKESQINDLTIESGQVPNEKLLRETIVDLAGYWLPGTQNGREVCAYVRLKLRFSGDRIDIQLMQ